MTRNCDGVLDEITPTENWTEWLNVVFDALFRLLATFMNLFIIRNALSINLFSLALFAFVLLAHHFFGIFRSKRYKRISREGRN